MKSTESLPIGSGKTLRMVEDLMRSPVNGTIATMRARWRRELDANNGWGIGVAKPECRFPSNKQHQFDEEFVALCAGRDRPVYLYSSKNTRDRQLEEFGFCHLCEEELR